MIDNGNGMSETDARLCFERHATSKIKALTIFFHIKTMGFRAKHWLQLQQWRKWELKTKRPDDETGTLIELENGIVLRQEPVAVANGACSMKNLFFNVPATQF